MRNNLKRWLGFSGTVVMAMAGILTVYFKTHSDPGPGRLRRIQPEAQMNKVDSGNGNIQQNSQGPAEARVNSPERNITYNYYYYMQRPAVSPAVKYKTRPAIKNGEDYPAGSRGSGQPHPTATDLSFIAGMVSKADTRITLVYQGEGVLSRNYAFELRDLLMQRGYTDIELIVNYYAPSHVTGITFPEGSVGNPTFFIKFE